MLVAKGEGVSDEATGREYVEGVGGWGLAQFSRLLCNT